MDVESLENELSIDNIIDNIQEVKNVYEHLNDGIVITSWENTDYAKANIVHVMKDNGERIKLSRRPTIYCPDFCGEEARAVAMLLK